MQREEKAFKGQSTDKKILGGYLEDLVKKKNPHQKRTIVSMTKRKDM